MFDLIASSKLQMRLLSPALLASLLVLGPVSCKRNGPSSSSDTTAAPQDGARGKRKRSRRPRGPKMPRPLSLPSDPDGVVHVAAPKTLLSDVLSYVPNAPSPRQVLQRAVRQSGLQFEAKLVEHVGLGRPWNIAVVDGQTIYQIPLKPKSTATVVAMLRSLPPEGDFGAVKIKRGPDKKAPLLAYVDRANNTITLADDLRGIATGPELQRAYGKQGVRISVTREEASRFGAQLPFSKLTAKGASADDLEIIIEGAPELPTNDLQKGALTGLLNGSQIAFGASSKYRNHKKDVEAILGKVKRQVNDAPGVVRGNLEDLRKRLATVLRHWNGRTMVGVGPSNHVLVGFGAEDSARMGKSTLFLMRGIVDNLNTAKTLSKTFGLNLSLPKIRFNPNVSTGAGVPVHVIVVDNARKYVPSEFHGLLNSDGRLKLAIAFPKRAGAGLLVAGADAKDVMAKWLEDTKNAPTGAKTRDHFVSVTSAVGPKFMQALEQATPQSVLRASANRPPTKVVVRRDGETYRIRVKRKTPARVGRIKNAVP